MTRFTDDTITDRTRWLAEVEPTRERWRVVNDSEHHNGVRAIAIWVAIGTE